MGAYQYQCICHGDLALLTISSSWGLIGPTRFYLPGSGPIMEIEKQAKNPNAKCVILMPVSGAMEWATEITLINLMHEGYAIQKIYGCANVDIARSQLASDALEQGFEELFWIDSDIGFTVDDFDRLRAHDLPLVCGLYPKKLKEGGLAAILSDDTEELVFGEHGGLIEIKWAGTGFLYTKRCVYDDIKVKLALPDCMIGKKSTINPYFMPFVIKYSQGNGDKDTYLYLGDDTSFCERARQVGYKVYADTTIRLDHIGKYRYSWEDIAGTRDRYSTLSCQIKRMDHEDKICV